MGAKKCRENNRNKIHEKAEGCKHPKIRVQGSAGSNKYRENGKGESEATEGRDHKGAALALYYNSKLREL